MSWTEKTFCTHGIPFSQPCDRCEIVGLKESLTRMTRRVKKDEKRLSELERKIEEEKEAGPVDSTVIPWRCFHCNEVFHNTNSARVHFGGSEEQRPACQLDINEYRRMEEAFRRSCNEDTDLHRALYAKEAQMTIAVMRAEEVGYAKGLEDAKKHPAELGLCEA